MKRTAMRGATYPAELEDLTDGPIGDTSYGNDAADSFVFTLRPGGYVYKLYVHAEDEEEREEGFDRYYLMRSARTVDEYARDCDDDPDLVEEAAMESFDTYGGDEGHEELLETDDPEELLQLIRNRSPKSGGGFQLLGRR